MADNIKEKIFFPVSNFSLICDFREFLMIMDDPHRRIISPVATLNASILYLSLNAGFPI